MGGPGSQNQGAAGTRNWNWMLLTKLTLVLGQIIKLRFLMLRTRLA